MGEVRQMRGAALDPLFFFFLPRPCFSSLLFFFFCCCGGTGLARGCGASAPRQLRSPRSARPMWTPPGHVCGGGVVVRASRWSTTFRGMDFGTGLFVGMRPREGKKWRVFGAIALENRLSSAATGEGTPCALSLLERARGQMTRRSGAKAPRRRLTHGAASSTCSSTKTGSRARSRTSPTRSNSSSAVVGRRRVSRSDHGQHVLGGCWGAVLHRAEIGRACRRARAADGRKKRRPATENLLHGGEPSRWRRSRFAWARAAVAKLGSSASFGQRRWGVDNGRRRATQLQHLFAAVVADRPFALVFAGRPEGVTGGSRPEE